ncbi:hypothetical protein EV363DRAFT_1451080 [Boletus edulis]|nr:hypothetical protein EV363DRAFT_1451080 [Boletus edulis]
MSTGQSPSDFLPAHGTVLNPLPAVPPSSSQSNTQHLPTLKRRIGALELENTLLLSKLYKKPVQNLRWEGRAVRRLVALVEPIADMIAERDRRQLSVAEGTCGETIQVESSPEQARTHNNFRTLVHWCPTVPKLLDTGEFDLFACRELQAGADSARGDDAATLKTEVIHWVVANHDRIEPPLSPRDKQARGLGHDLTGGLLCPVDYDWGDSSVRTAIQEYHPDFRVTAFSWPNFLYKDNTFDRNNLSKGLFQGELLVKSFKCIFTSPMSAHHLEGGEGAIQSKGPGHRTRNNVAALLKMKTIQPRAIAYIAVQVRFALSSASSWAVVDEDFNYEEFYLNIVDYLEAPSSPEKAAEIKNLLLWWNR